jgi:hypothetical protein
VRNASKRFDESVAEQKREAQGIARFAGAAKETASDADAGGVESTFLKRLRRVQVGGRVWDGRGEGWVGGGGRTERLRVLNWFGVGSGRVVGRGGGGAAPRVSEG